MARLTRATVIGIVRETRFVTKPRVILWLAAATLLASPMVLLTVSINSDPFPSQDRTVLDWVVARDIPLLAGFSSFMSKLSSNYTLLAVGGVTVAFFWLVGMTHVAVAFVFVGGVVGAVAYTKYIPRKGLGNVLD